MVGYNERDRFPVGMIADEPYFRKEKAYTYILDYGKAIKDLLHSYEGGYLNLDESLNPEPTTMDVPEGGGITPSPVDFDYFPVPVKERRESVLSMIFKKIKDKV